MSIFTSSRHQADRFNHVYQAELLRVSAKHSHELHADSKAQSICSSSAMVRLIGI